MKKLTVSTSVREQMIDITEKVREAVDGSIRSGAAMIFCPHTTCGLTINEGFDPDVVRDMTRFFHETIPFSHDWRHAEGNSDAHIKSSLLGSSLLIPIENGKLQLGTWQAVYLYEGDGPRPRSIWVTLLAGV